MTRIPTLVGGGLVLAATTSFIPAIAAAQSDSPLMDVLVVSGQRAPAATTDQLRPDDAALTGADAAGLVARLPGAALTNNGALSGQVQYHGLYGPRIAIRVDGQAFASGGPNLMDPPLHYAPPALIDRLEVARGVGPVSDGPGLGGGVNAVFKRVDFGASDEPEFHYDLSASGRTTDDSYALGGIAGMATQDWRVNLMASQEEGGDIGIPGGTLRDSGHERLVYGVNAGLNYGSQEIGIEARRQETGPTGNPPFPMDIRYFDTNFLHLTYGGDLSFGRIEASFGYVDVSHAMNNFDLRPAPADPTRYREALADSRTLTGEAALVLDAGGGMLRLGGDIADEKNNVDIINPNNANFLVSAFPHVEQARYGAFAQWTGTISGVNGELGVRVDQHEASAGMATLGSALPMGPQMLAMQFNASGRSRDDTTIDAVIRLWTAVSDDTTVRLTLARKTRVAGYVEHFGWLPLTASGGLADGNTYVGDINLKPEVAWIAEAGFDWKGRTAYARPTVYYRRVDDYIQGVPYDGTPGVADSMVEMVSAMNGDPTPLRFANVDADLWGVDVDFGIQASGALRIDGMASLVRGKRRDIDDHLYRLAAPNLTLAATYELSKASLTLETVMAARQSQVSITNSEQPTGGYAVVNLHGTMNLGHGAELSAGIDNLFDRAYADHLAGINRIMGSGVPVGAPVPGAGRGVYLRLHVAR